MVAKNDEEAENVDPCTGFSTTHKAKLSIPNISWTRFTRTGSIPKEFTMGAGELKEINTLSALEQAGSEDDCHYRRCFGIFFALLSALTFSINALIANKMLSHFPPFWLAAVSFLFMTLFSLIIISYEVKVKKNPEIMESVHSCNYRNTFAFLLMRGFTSVFSLVFFFYAIKYITVVDVTTINGISPIFVYLMAFIFFGDLLGIVPLLAALLAFIGIALIMKPPLLLMDNETNYDTKTLIGVALSFSKMICVAGTIIALRFLKNIHYSVVNCTFGILGTLQCIILALICGSDGGILFDFPSSLLELAQIFASGILFFAAHTFLTLALHYEEAGPVGLLATMEVVFAFIWLLLFFGEITGGFSVLGVTLVIFAAILTIGRKWIGSLPEDNNLREKCQILLS